MKGLGEKGGALPHFYGHRDRLKARFRQSGADSLQDYELLELILFQSVPRRDTKPLAKALLARFGSFSEVLAASEERLKEVDGVGDAVAHQLKILLAAAQRFARDPIRRATVLDSYTGVVDYCRAAMAFAPIEQLRCFSTRKTN
jgi:DNA repair protein RadC